MPALNLNPFLGHHCSSSLPRPHRQTASDVNKRLIRSFHLTCDIAPESTVLPDIGSSGDRPRPHPPGFEPHQARSSPKVKTTNAMTAQPERQIADGWAGSGRRRPSRRESSRRTATPSRTPRAPPRARHRVNRIRGRDGCDQHPDAGRRTSASWSRRSIPRRQAAGTRRHTPAAAITRPMAASARLMRRSPPVRPHRRSQTPTAAPAIRKPAHGNSVNVLAPAAGGDTPRSGRAAGSATASPG